MTRGVKVGVRSVLLVLLSVLLVLLLVPRFQRTLLDPLSRGPSPRAGRSARPHGEGWRGGAAGPRAALSLDPEALDLR